MIAARQTFLNGNGKEGWINPYVTDGIITQWDGIWNTGGGGVHNSSSDVWKDLAGNYDLTIDNGSFGADHFVVGGTRCAYNTNMPDGIATIEIVLLSNTPNNIETLIWATDNPSNEGRDKRQCCWLYHGSIGFGFNAYGTPQLIGEKNSYACTFSSRQISAPDVTYLNGKPYTYLGAYDYFNSFLADKMAINPRYGTFIGKIYALRIYSRVLNADEIAANYAMDALRFNLSTSS